MTFQGGIMGRFDWETPQPCGWWWGERSTSPILIGWVRPPPRPFPRFRGRRFLNQKFRPLVFKQKHACGCASPLPPVTRGCHSRAPTARLRCLLWGKPGPNLCLADAAGLPQATQRLSWPHQATPMRRRSKTAPVLHLQPPLSAYHSPYRGHPTLTDRTGAPSPRLHAHYTAFATFSRFFFLSQLSPAT